MKNKKLISALVIMTMVILAGCSSSANLGFPPLPTPTDSVVIPETDSQNDAEPAAVESEMSEEDESSSCQVLISISNCSPEYIYDPNTSDEEDNLILTFLSEKPVVDISDNKEASKKINDYFYCMDEEIITGDEYGVALADYPGKNNLLNLATDNYQIHVDYKLDNRLDFAFSHTVDVLRCDSSVISFMFTDYSYTGDGSGKYAKYAVSFDSNTGEVFKCDFFTSVDSMRDVLSRNIVNRSNEYDWCRDLSESDDYLDTLTKMIEDGNWYIGNNGMVFLYSDNDTEQFGSGIYEIEVPFEECSAQISQIYVSPAKEGKGTLSANKEHDNVSEILDLVIVSQDGDTVYLNAEGTIYDIRIKSVQYSDTDSTFYPKTVLWAGNYFADSSIQLQTLIPDGMPDILISYFSNGNETSLLLSDSGKDNQPVLVESSINAVG